MAIISEANGQNLLILYKTALQLACEDIKDYKRFCPKYHKMWDCSNNKCPNAGDEWSCWFHAYVNQARNKISS